jgi:hypothetical protein
MEYLKYSFKNWFYLFFKKKERLSLLIWFKKKVRMRIFNFFLFLYKYCLEPMLFLNNFITRKFYRNIKLNFIYASFFFYFFKSNSNFFLLKKKKKKFSKKMKQ